MTWAWDMESFLPLRKGGSGQMQFTSEPVKTYMINFYIILHIYSLSDKFLYFWFSNQILTVPNPNNQE